MKESNRLINESFHTVLIKHLDLMQNKDIIPFLQTISEQEDISVIMPNGRLIKGYKDVTEFNKDWLSCCPCISIIDIIKFFNSFTVTILPLILHKFFPFHCAKFHGTRQAPVLRPIPARRSEHASDK